MNVNSCIDKLSKDRKILYKDLENKFEGLMNRITFLFDDHNLRFQASILVIAFFHIKKLDLVKKNFDEFYIEEEISKLNDKQQEIDKSKGITTTKLERYNIAKQNQYKNKLSEEKIKNIKTSLLSLLKKRKITMTETSWILFRNSDLSFGAIYGRFSRWVHSDGKYNANINFEDENLRNFLVSKGEEING